MGFEPSKSRLTAILACSDVRTVFNFGFRSYKGSRLGVPARPRLRVSCPLRPGSGSRTRSDATQTVAAFRDALPDLYQERRPPVGALGAFALVLIRRQSKRRRSTATAFVLAGQLQPLVEPHPSHT